ncbi:hypothetical protein [Deinococcus multiflagellatus]|uniref:Uncharacterized protein n=1 Tax=Deinococcus multiflagellatus TaxID=1656887 RepID=A0ABW1ZMW4_9DEIO|nr:hypothetical protein [Deinococcus multiflagellatus]MBZ9714199.1 hypothetical protein [Deinococcus multiflagellatus]
MARRPWQGLGGALLALSLLSGGAGAATVAIATVLSDGTRATTVGGLDPVSLEVTRQLPGAAPLKLGVSLNGQIDSTAPGRVSGVTVAAPRARFSAAEQGFVTGLVGRLATQCFNLLPARRAAIAAWLGQQNAAGARRVAATFGPLKLQWARGVDSGNRPFTELTLGRSGTPGAAPWVNACRAY